MKNQPGAAGLPVGAGGMLAQALHRREARAAVVAHEKPGRLDADIEAAVAGRHRPGRRDRRLARLIGEALARMGPACAPVDRFPHRRAKPAVAARAIDRAVAWIADDMVDRPGLAEWPRDRPALAPLVAVKNEHPFFGADEHLHLARHCASPRSSRSGGLGRLAASASSRSEGGLMRAPLVERRRGVAPTPPPPPRSSWPGLTRPSKREGGQTRASHRRCSLDGRVKPGHDGVGGWPGHGVSEGTPVLAIQARSRRRSLDGRVKPGHDARWVVSHSSLAARRLSPPGPRAGSPAPAIRPRRDRARRASRRRGAWRDRRRRHRGRGDRRRRAALRASRSRPSARRCAPAASPARASR